MASRGTRICLRSLFPRACQLTNFGGVKGRRALLILGILAAIMVIVMAVKLVHRATTPKWQGKTAAQWFNEFRAVGRVNWTATLTGGPGTALGTMPNGQRMVLMASGQKIVVTASGQPIIISSPPGT